MFSTTQVLCNNLESSSAPPPIPPPTDNMIAYLKFDSGDFSGTTLANYSTGSKVFNATLSGTTLPILSTTSVKVGSGSCNIASNTTQSMITLPTISSVGLTAFSVCFWFLSTNLGQSYRHIWCIGPDVSYYIRYQGNNLVCLGYGIGSAYDNGAWHHIACTISSNGVGSVYMDNVLLVSNYTFSSTFAQQSTTTWNNYIGQFTSTAPSNQSVYAFSGNIDDFRIYSRLLTATEVGLIYKNTT